MPQSTARIDAVGTGQDPTLIRWALGISLGLLAIYLALPVPRALHAWGVLLGNIAAIAGLGADRKSVV